MQFRPAAVAVAYLLGIACGVGGRERAAALLALAVALAGGPGRATPFALAAGLGLGALRAALDPVTPPVATGIRTVAGRVLEVRPQTGGATSVLVRPDGRRGAVTAFVAGEVPTAVAVGGRVVLRGVLRPPEPPRNPGEPDPRALAAERGVVGELDRARLRAIAAPDPRDPANALPLARAWAARTLRARIAEPEASVLAGALLGERGTLPPDLRAAFQDTGTVHVLVTAGLHLGVIAAATLGLLRALRCGRATAALGTIPALWTYAAFSGGHLPSIRAAACASVLLLAHALGRPAFSWNVLGLAAIAVATLDPRSVFTLSFALSFSCVAAIALLAQPIARACERARLPKPLAHAVALTAATQLGTWPLSARAFLILAPFALLANAVVVPLIAVAMIAGALTLVATPVPPLAELAAGTTATLLAGIVAAVRGVAALPAAHLVATPPSIAAITAYDVALVAAAALCARAGRTEERRRRRALRAGAVLLVGLACAVCLAPPPRVRELDVAAIDVGQADALLVQTPGGHAVLVDAGGRLERGTDGEASAEAIGTRIVLPFLLRRGVQRLDAIVLTHPHGDHVGGVPPVVRALAVGLVADSGQSYPGAAYARTLLAAREREVPVRVVRAGETWRFGDGTELKFLAPEAPLLQSGRNDVNENSLVFMLTYGSFRMLFTGDAGAESEARMLASGADLHADVLKVGHHGSAYGSTPGFVRAVAPRVAIVSDGRDNAYGHPAPETLATLRAAHATVYRTDEDGEIDVRSDGRTFTVRPFLR